MTTDERCSRRGVGKTLASLFAGSHGVIRAARKALLVAVMVAAAGFPLAMRAQLNTATLQGVARDASGAVIPNAAVSVKNVDTGVLKATVSGEQGEFFVPSLQPGTYDITISHQGFQTAKQTSVKLEVGQQANLDFVLPAGSTSETVTVATTLSEIPNTDTTLGTVIEQQQVVDLPLNGRQFSQLIQLAPGVVPIDNSQNAGKAPNFGAGAASPSVNGQTNRSNIFFLDGIIDSNPFFGGFSFSPSVDDIQEFKAASHTDQAEFGQATGAIVSVITRPGTNTFHGSVFEFNRNTIFNTQIRNFSSSPTTKLPYHQNQFGGSLGGPILRGKLFFFANYEGGRQVTPTPGYSTVPTVAERNGDFSGVLPGGVTPVIYDPSTYDPVTHTVQPFPGNIIPTPSINTGMQAYLNAIYPQPNAPLLNGANNLYTTTGNQTFGDQGSVRIDYTLGTKDSFNGRYSQNQASVSSAASLADIFTTGFNGKNAGGNWTHTYNATTVSQITVAYNTLNIPQQIVLPVSQDAVFTSAGLGAGFPKNPGLTPFTLVPDMGLQGGSYSGFWNGAGPIGPMAITQVAGSLSKVVNKHALKFGGSFYRTAMYTNWSGNHFDFSNKATWNTACQFDLAVTAACPTFHATAGDLGAGGDPVASLLLSLPIDATRNLGNTGVNLRQKVTSLFAQDTFTITPQLTMTFGLRWDYGTPVTETNNRLAVYNIYTKKYQIAAGDIDLPSGTLPPNVVVSGNNSITNKYYTYFQPRLGFAYQPNPKLTLRVGAGRTFDVWGLPLQVAQQNRGAWPSGFAQIASSQSLNIAGVSLKPDGTVYSGQNPFTGPGVIPASPLPAGGLGFQDTKWQTASSFQWNAEVQRDFRSVGSLKVAYVGSETEHLTINYPYNLAPASTNSTSKVYPDQIFGAPGNDLLSAATGSYHSFQTQLSRSYANGLVYNFTYTYSRARALAICGTDFNVCVQDPYNLPADRGPTNLDIPHIFTFNTAYQLPTGKGRQYLNSGPAAYILGNWQVNSIITARSGTVINPTNSFNGDTANAGGGNQRISFNGDPESGARHTISSYFNPTAFVTPAPGTYGNAGLNSLRGPGFWNVDFSLFKNFPIRERASFQFRAEAFDLFNHPNLSNPNASFAGTTVNNNGTTSYNNGFNTITSTLPNSNRVIQLAGKILF